MSILWRIAATLLGTTAAARAPTTPPAITLVALHPVLDDDTDSVEDEPPAATARGPPPPSRPQGPVLRAPPGQATPTSATDRPQGELLSATTED